MAAIHEGQVLFSTFFCFLPKMLPQHPLPLGKPLGNAQQVCLDLLALLHYTELFWVIPHGAFSTPKKSKTSKGADRVWRWRVSQQDHAVPLLIFFSPVWSSEATELGKGRFVHNRCDLRPPCRIWTEGPRHERGKGLPGLGATRMEIRGTLKLFFSHLLEACATTML